MSARDDKIDLVAINLGARLARDSCGTEHPITHLFDSWGEETDDPDEAVALVAGADDLWFSATVDEFEPGELLH